MPTPPFGFTNTDQLIVAAVSILREVATQIGFTNPTPEPWHWDSPTVTIAWTDNQAIGRNVNFIFDSPDDYVAQPPATLTIEVNAWKDSSGTRLWKHQIIARQSLNFTRYSSIWNTQLIPNLGNKLDANAIRNFVHQGFDTVISWKETDLNRST